MGGKIIENGANALIKSKRFSSDILTEGITLESVVENVVGSQIGKGTTSVLGGKVDTKRLKSNVERTRSRNTRVNSNSSSQNLSNARITLNTQTTINVARNIVPEVVSKSVTNKLQEDDKN